MIPEMLSTQVASKLLTILGNVKSNLTPTTTHPLPLRTEFLINLTIYACLANQLALTVEEQQEGPQLILHQQNKLISIELSPRKLETALTYLRHAYCENETSTVHHERIFPPVKNLLTQQKLWHLVHVPKKLESHGVEEHFDSLISADEQFFLTRNQWLVGIGCKEKRGFWNNLINAHAFMIIEGIDQYGHGLYLRFDLVINQGDAIEKGTYFVRPLKQAQNLVSLEERAEALKTEIIGKGTIHFVTWPIQRETEAVPLIRNILVDQEKKEIPYAVLGSNSQSSSSRQTTSQEQAFNCLSWARTHIKNILHSDNYNQDLKGEKLDNGSQIPGRLIKKIATEDRNSCSLL